jgi:hypothetical protein
MPAAKAGAARAMNGQQRKLSEFGVEAEIDGSKIGTGFWQRVSGLAERLARREVAFT